MDGGWGGEEGVGGPPLDPVPNTVHALEGTCAGGVQVDYVSHNREEEAFDDVLAEEGSNTCAQRGKSFSRNKRPPGLARVWVCSGMLWLGRESASSLAML